jgi:hypothetical protein
LIADEQRLYSHNHLKPEEKQRLSEIQIELDQYWDLLRQRRALREAGGNPDDAQMRDPGTVENYEQ